jgi:hypothetical protein
MFTSHTQNVGEKSINNKTATYTDGMEREKSNFTFSQNKKPPDEK